jgi:hypothetical protein
MKRTGLVIIGLCACAFPASVSSATEIALAGFSKEGVSADRRALVELQS